MITAEVMLSSGSFQVERRVKLMSKSIGRLRGTTGCVSLLKFSAAVDLEI